VHKLYSPYKIEKTKNQNKISNLLPKVFHTIKPEKGIFAKKIINLTQSIQASPLPNNDFYN
jgi:hypothetical protein